MLVLVQAQALGAGAGAGAGCWRGARARLLDDLLRRDAYSLPANNTSKHVSGIPARAWLAADLFLTASRVGLPQEPSTDH